MSEYTRSDLLRSMELCENKHGKVTTTVMDDDPDLPHSYYVSKEFGTFSNGKLEADLNDTGQIHLTDSEMERINDSITDYQKNIMWGLLMGDGWIDTEEGKTSKMAVEMVNKDFLLWVENELDDIVSSFEMRSTAEELAAKNRSYGYTVNEENYNDMWRIKTRSLEYFDTLRKWYSSGVKRFPNDLELNAITLKVWYCCDGSFVQNEYPVIYSSDQSDVRDSVLSLFDDIDVNPSFTDGGGGTIQFKRDDCTNFFEYVGEPPPGFEYKWPERYK